MSYKGVCFNTGRTHFKKGMTPWNKGLHTGIKPWFGKKRSEETINKIKMSRKGITAREKHPQWKGGITTENKLQRALFRKTIQKEVFKRDNYTCQICGIKGKDMQVDHIQSWKDYVELRFNINNCRTLCAKCHYKITYHKDMPKNVKTFGHNLKEVLGL